MNERRSGASVRIKLALSYAVIVIVAGCAMFAVGFLLLRYVPDANLTGGMGFIPNRSDLTKVYVKYVWWALAVLTALGVVGGWLLAGRMLRPLARIADAAQRVHDGDFSHRIALPGRRDELTDLADAFDEMVARVQATLDDQRRFAANASHELRTPLTIIRTMLEVARAAPEKQDTAALLERIDEMNERSITLTQALLTLAAVDQRPLLRRPVDLADIAAEAIDLAVPIGNRIRIDAELDAAPTTGDAALLTQLAANLVGNALAYNVESGFVRVATSTSGGGAILTVENSGQRLDPMVVHTLTEPFVRGAGRTRSTTGGVGLGLAIVASIVRAHGGRLELAAREDGGLRVRAVIPAR